MFEPSEFESSAGGSGDTAFQREEAAIATWTLKRRWRADQPLADAVALRRVLARGHPAGDGTFEYRGRRIALRPTVARLLAELWKVGGRPVPVADLCAATYGRPATLRAIRQTAFRCNRAMERVGCPINVACRAASVLMTFNSRRAAAFPCDERFQPIASGRPRSNARAE